jgi:membrane protein DedA with SNARE-associated domain
VAGLLAASMIVPVPDDALLLVAGSLVYQGELAYVPTVAAGVLGSATGMTVSYGLGRWLGMRRVERAGRFVHLDNARLEAWRDRYVRWGTLSVFFGYFVPGLRHVAAFLAGSSGLPWVLFAAFGYSGGLVWAAGMVTLGYFFGAEWAHVPIGLHRLLLGLGIAVAALAVVAALVRRWLHG